MIALALLLQTSASGWTASPARPTVGDTIRLERVISAAPGWRLRVGKLSSGGVAEPLADPSVIATAPDSWVVRYPIAAWSPGDLSLDMPPIWKLGPDGTADSIAGGTAVFHVASVIPDTAKAPAPQPALGPLRLERRNLVPVAAAALLAAGVLMGLLAWRRRGPRVIPARPVLAAERDVADTRWLAAGEPKAVAARATQRLRRALAQAIPDAHEALSTAECLAAVERARPDAPLRELRELLTALDQVAFAAAHGVEIGPLAARARALAGEFGNGNGGKVTAV
jgi:hypothetical protein